MNLTYTPLYDWVMADRNLSLLDALIICRVLHWNDLGCECFESNATLARLFNVDRRTIIRSLKKLIGLGWLAPLPDGRQRTFFINPDKLKAGPLFEDLTGDSDKMSLKLDKLSKKQ